MLKILSGEEVIMSPLSDSDYRLKGKISIRNDFKDHFIVYKLKSTNITLFEANPMKGILKPHQIEDIAITTLGLVDGEMAREISQKNKFMIEYIALNSCPNDIDDAINKLKGPTVQHTKIFINTNSVRTSALSKHLQEPSMVNSNKFSFHSMVGPRNIESRRLEKKDRESPDVLEKLKGEIEYLEKQRAKMIKDISSDTPKAKSGSYKYILYLLLFIVGLVCGNLVNKSFNLTKQVQESMSNIKILPNQQEEKEEGFFDIFNIGPDQSQREEEKSSFWGLW